MIFEQAPGSQGPVKVGWVGRDPSSYDKQSVGVRGLLAGNAIVAQGLRDTPDFDGALVAL